MCLTCCTHGNTHAHVIECVCVFLVLHILHYCCHINLSGVYKTFKMSFFFLTCLFFQISTCHLILKPSIRNKLLIVLSPYDYKLNIFVPRQTKKKTLCDCGKAGWDLSQHDWLISSFFLVQVFFSAYIFNSNVMVKVATQPAENPIDVLSRKLHLGPGMGRDVPRLSLPGKLVFPR